MMIDHQQRERALDPKQSFIVQAPAGSGKTELLTQRYLVLLAQTQKVPEEVLAITFTRKAAAEMRGRIVTALQSAIQNSPPQEIHRRKTWELASAVLLRDQKEGWNLLSNPNRLRIQTIDSLCAKITSLTPILSHFGFQPKISDDVIRLYEIAARTVLDSLNSNAPWVDDLSVLLLHLDNDHNKVEKLLIAMLKRRDQWLPHIIDPNPREILQASLAHIIQEQLEKVRTSVSLEHSQELLNLLDFAAETLPHFAHCKNLTALPNTEVSALAQWLTIARFLLTKDKQWRQKYTMHEGFPAPSSAKEPYEKARLTEMKNRISKLIEILREHHSVHQELAALLELPPPVYTEEQWQVVAALVNVLPIVVAQLSTLFKEYGIVDYTEISLRALEALGSSAAPTDLALLFDYSIQHILVDEFQDTSITQFRLLEQLTAGWQANEGRTLFLVGDPMQSIYRFRKAEVGLFLQAKYKGINAIKLEPLLLSVNFRSQEAIVTWLNKIFAVVFPPQDNLASGAIRYNLSSPFAKNDESGETGVQVHALVEGQAYQETDVIVSLIKEAWQKDPKQSIGILVLARNYLLNIFPALQLAGIPYRAVEIEKLSHRGVVQDLLALTRALLHPADRIAWLAILRAPWCGLTLADLLVIVGEDHTIAIWDRLLQLDTTLLSPAGRQRVEWIVPIFRHSIRNQRRVRLARWVEAVWLMLGGPACITTSTDLDDATEFFRLLNELDKGGDISDFNHLERRLDNFFAAPNNIVGPVVEVMTIHKAKGLEFDTVILPSLDRKFRSEDHQLLLWQECPGASGRSELLLAPIKTADENAIYDYLRLQEHKKLVHEMARLLYVATSRAKNKLHLIAHLHWDEEEANEIKKPIAGSLLEKLWEPCQDEFIQSAGQLFPPFEKGGLGGILGQQQNPEKKDPGSLKRLASAWQHPMVSLTEKMEQVDSLQNSENSQVPPKIVWHSETLKHMGTVLHRIFYQICLHGLSMWQPHTLIEKRPYIEALLRNLGVVVGELDFACQRIELALQKTLADTRGRWLLKHDHAESQAEYPLSLVKENKVIHLVLDRTFVADDVRWIVDYKLASPEEQDLATFLKAQQQSYRPQLELYAQAMQSLDFRPIRLGLYFPLVSGWCEWEYFPLPNSSAFP